MRLPFDRIRVRQEPGAPGGYEMYMLGCEGLDKVRNVARYLAGQSNARGYTAARVLLTEAEMQLLREKEQTGANE